METYKRHGKQTEACFVLVNAHEQIRQTWQHHVPLSLNDWTYARRQLRFLFCVWYIRKFASRTSKSYSWHHAATVTPWSRGLLEKLTVYQLAKKCPAFYGTRKFITAFTRARHVSLSWASSIQSMPPSHCLKIYFNITLPSTPGSPKWSPSLRSPHENPACTSLFRR
jgi:hypothetical protein